MSERWFDEFVKNIQDTLRNSAQLELTKAPSGAKLAIKPRSEEGASIVMIIEYEGSWLDICIGECCVEWDMSPSKMAESVQNLLSVIRCVSAGEYTERTWLWLNHQVQIVGSVPLENPTYASFGRTKLHYFLVFPWTQIVEKKYPAY